jgi:hypothetical protein
MRRTKYTYYERSIEPSTKGSGYRLGEYSAAHGWDNLCNLEESVAKQCGGTMLRLFDALHDQDFLAAGVQNIRDHIEGGTPYVTYAVLQQDGTLTYRGVELHTERF